MILYNVPSMLAPQPVRAYTDLEQFLNEAVLENQLKTIATGKADILKQYLRAFASGSRQSAERTAQSVQDFEAFAQDLKNAVMKTGNHQATAQQEKRLADIKTLMSEGWALSLRKRESYEYPALEKTVRFKMTFPHPCPRPKLDSDQFTHDMGLFLLSLPITNTRDQRGYPMCWPAGENIPVTSDYLHQLHPHARRDGRICLGEIESRLYDLLTKGKLLMASDVLIQMLSTYNGGSPYISHAQIFSAIQCLDCRRNYGVDVKRAECDKCGRKMCLDCINSCAVCGRHYCTKCAGKAKGSEEALCPFCNELVTCAHCNRQLLMREAVGCQDTDCESHRFERLYHKECMDKTGDGVLVCKGNHTCALCGKIKLRKQIGLQRFWRIVNDEYLECVPTVCLSCKRKNGPELSTGLAAQLELLIQRNATPATAEAAAPAAPTTEVREVPVDYVPVDVLDYDDEEDDE